MPAKYCLNHRAVDAVAQCHQCHKPICRECLVTDANGQFCSTQCAAKNANFKASYKEAKLAGPSLMSRLIGAAVGVAILLGIVHAAVRFLGISFLASFDLIGKFLH